jgi:competence protein ComEC
VNGLILSHRHRDHTGALASFLEGMEVKAVYDAGYGDGGTASVVDSVLAAHRLWPCLVAAGDTLHRAAGLHIVVVHPPRGDPRGPPPDDNLNEASLMVRVVDGDLEVLYAGDGERLAEATCLSGLRTLAARVLKVGHHGSATSSSPRFLQAIKPRLAVISCGAGNRFGHPARSTLKSFQELGVRVVRTDRSGSVVVFSQADTMKLVVHPPRNITPDGVEEL